MSVLRGSKPKKASELKVGNIILTNASKKAKILSIRKVKASADMQGLKGAPIQTDFYVVEYEWLDYKKKGKDGVKYTRTYQANEFVTWYPEKKRMKFGFSALVVAFTAGLLVGTALLHVLTS